MDGKGGATRAAAIEARRIARLERMRDRLAKAQTPEAKLASAYDWLRSSLSQLARSGVSRTGLAPNRPAAERLMRETASRLAALAEEMDGGLHDSR
jgi:hypothetical protein